MFFGGLAFTTYLLSELVVPEWRANRHFAQTRCVVISKRLLTLERSDGTRQYRPEIQILYDVGGNSYQARTYDIVRGWSDDERGQARLLDGFETGKTYPCWYDRLDPAVAVVARGYTWNNWLLLLIPLSFVIAGGGGLGISLWRWGKSAERRAAQARNPLELLDPAAAVRRDFPTLPAALAITDSPGTTLVYRLPHDVRSMWAILTLLIASCVIVLAAVVLGAIAVADFVDGRADAFKSAFIAGWFTAGVLGIVFSVRRLLQASAAGPTILEISDHPVFPGHDYDLYLLQSGRVGVKSVEVHLLCDERATFQQGTNTRTETRRVFQHPVEPQGEPQRPRRGRHETRLALRMPHRAMHSFRSVHNSIEWRLVVKAKLDGGLDLERWFPIVVYPHCEGSEHACDVPA